ncbi:hypothetical protein F5146DRAFT_1004861 [Armillaria mellea]|nr:hypothetical protein F5146DRAFT_1004861 [Armillaria mellea]
MPRGMRERHAIIVGMIGEIIAGLHEHHTQTRIDNNDDSAPLTMQSSIVHECPIAEAGSWAIDEPQYPALTLKQRSGSKLQDHATASVLLIEDIITPWVKEEDVEVCITEMGVVKAVKEEEASALPTLSYLSVSRTLPVIVPWEQLMTVRQCHKEMGVELAQAAAVALGCGKVDGRET